VQRTTRFLALTLLTVIAASGCSGGGKTDATTQAGGNAAAGSNAGAPADDDDNKIAQGTDLEKAESAGLGSDGAKVISVVGTDTACTPDVKSVEAGKIWVKFTNSGTKISEIYLETAKGDKLAEVERITAGKSGGFSFEVKSGSYQLSCVPGMGDNQIQVPLTVG
jgi:hypothetical protein